MITTRHTLAALVLPASLVLATPLHAQDDTTISDEAIEAAIRAFNERNRNNDPNEVVVVLDPPAEEETVEDTPADAEVAEDDQAEEVGDTDAEEQLAADTEDSADNENPTTAPETAETPDDGESTADAGETAEAEAEPAASGSTDEETEPEAPAVAEEDTTDGSDDPDSGTPADAGDEPADGNQPVLVTGKPPVDSGVIDISDIPLAEDDTTVIPIAPPEPRPGLEVRVKNIRSGSGSFDTSKVRLLAPFPAKPLIPPPAGWRLETSKEAPPFKRDVELAPGRSITLTIHPHLLVPDADGSERFAVLEPGFQASLGYQQSDTVAGVLSQSIEQLDEDSKHLGTVIDQLQQLIVSLPKPDAPAPADAQAPSP